MHIVNKEKGIVYYGWGIKDVRKLISDRNIRFKNGTLTDAECLNILIVAGERFDHYEGIDYDVLEFWLANLYRDKIASARSKQGWYR